MPPDPREELAEIIDQAVDYLSWMKADGVAEVEIAIGSGTPARPTVRAAVPPTACSPRSAQALRPDEKLMKKEPAPGQADPELLNIAADIAGCKQCPLHQTRIQTVPGQGNPRPEIMFIGEAPGADEDEQGLAFIGKAGQLLTKMIEAMGFTREEVFIANIAKCRPPGNRPPTPEEMATCLPFLRRQIAVIKPKVVVALGAVSVRGLLQNETPISKVRGLWQEMDGIAVMPTFHPAYLLRNPPAKKEVWDDLQAVLKRLGRTPPPVRKAG